MREWDIYQTDEVAAWLDELSAEDRKSAELVDDAIYALSCSGPSLGRPLVDTITASKIKNLKEVGDLTRGREQRRQVEPLVRRGDPEGRAAV